MIMRLVAIFLLGMAVTLVWARPAEQDALADVVFRTDLVVPNLGD